MFGIEEKSSKRFVSWESWKKAPQLLGSCWRHLFGSQVAKCCGIVGYIGKDSAESILVDGIRILQSRGYDSCGISTISDTNELVTTKFASQGSTSDCIELLAKCSSQKHAGHTLGIGHTRWATHGPKTNVNAHPHHDWYEKISLVHNGTIDNYVTLKQRLTAENYSWRSDTDTEVIANLISWYLEKSEDLLTAVQAACSELEGTWGLAVICRMQTDQIVLARNGSPLLVGNAGEEVYVASECSALARYTNQYYALADGETCSIKVGEIHKLNKRMLPQLIPRESILTSPKPYSHWTIREIYEQPASILRALNQGARIDIPTSTVKLGGLDSAKDQLLKIQNFIITGCGTSMHAGMYGERLMRFLRCFSTVMAVDASEITEDYLPAQHGGMVLLSQSGETLDVIRAFQLSQHSNIQRFSIVNVVGSHLARLTDCGVYINAGREVAVASTKTFSSQVCVLALVAVWFAQHLDVFPHQRQQILQSVRRLPEAITMTLESHQEMSSLALRLKDEQHIFILGKGLAYCVALEGALKIKEISYIHAEGFPAGSLKHGPFALLDPDTPTPVILLVTADESIPLMRNAAEQIKARKAFIVGILEESVQNAFEGLFDVQTFVPSLGLLTPVLMNVLLQLLAYELAIARNIDPDKPRGLAKTVTVV